MIPPDRRGRRRHPALARALEDVGGADAPDLTPHCQGPGATAGTPRPRQPARLPPRRDPCPPLAHGVTHRRPAHRITPSPRTTMHRVRALGHGPGGGRGTVKCSGSVADLADEPRHAERPWLSIAPRDHQPRRLAVSPRRCERSRCRRSPGPPRPHGVLRSDPAVVPHGWFSRRAPAHASTGPAGRHSGP